MALPTEIIAQITITGDSGYQADIIDLLTQVYMTASGQELLDKLLPTVGNPDGKKIEVVFETGNASTVFDIPFQDSVIKLDLTFAASLQFIDETGDVIVHDENVAGKNAKLRTLAHELFHAIDEIPDPDYINDIIVSAFVLGDIDGPAVEFANSVVGSTRSAYWGGTTSDSLLLLDPNFDYTAGGRSFEVVVVGSIPAVDRNPGLNLIGNGSYDILFIGGPESSSPQSTPNGFVDFFIRSGSGDDTIFAGAGDDIVLGSLGSDYLDGQSDSDTLTFTELTGQKIVVTVGPTPASGETQTFFATSYADVSADPTPKGSDPILLPENWQDTFLNFEKLVGTDSDYDLLDFRDFGGSVGSPGENLITINGQTIEIESFEIAYGVSYQNDTIKLGQGHNFISDGAFNAAGSNDSDELHGGTGADRFVTYFGNDTVYGGADADQFYVVHGNVEIYGGTGDDVYNLVNASGNDQATIHLELGFDHDAIVMDDDIFLLPTETPNSYQIGQIHFNGIDPNDVSLVWDYTETLVNQGIEDSYVQVGAAEIRVSNGAGGSLYIPRLWGSYDVFEGIVNRADWQDGLPDLAFTINGQTTVYSGSEGYAALFGRPLPSGTPNAVEPTTLGVGPNTAVDNHLAERATPDDGSGGDDTPEGTEVADNIDTGGGNDIVLALGGNDTIVATGAGIDLYDGGSGTDTITFAGLATGVAVDLSTGIASSYDIGLNTLISIEDVIGGDGDDIITGSNASNALSGGAGSDTIVGGNGNDIIDGGSEDDTIEGGTGSDTIDGGTGNDTIYAGGWGDTVNAGDGNDTVWGGAGRDVITLGNGDDVFEDEEATGYWQSDTVYGGDGNDIINARGGHDILNGGKGSDTIFGGIGNDVIDGGGWADVIDAGDGNDIVHGGNGRDIIDLGAGNDVFEDESNTGYWQSDTINGGAGDDTINGLGGNEIITGGTDNDLLTGGVGSDTFIFALGDGQDVITDFEDGVDVISFSGSGLLFANLTISTDGNGDALIAYGSTDLITLSGAGGLLDANDFVF